jgi:hypothetical protein
MMLGLKNFFKAAKIRQGAFVITSTVASSAALWLIGSFVGNISERWWLLLLPLPVILLGMHFNPVLPSYARSILTGIIISPLVIFCIIGMQLILKNLAEQPLLDFPIFWILGKAAAQGQNFYHREVLLEIARPYNFPSYFINELNGMYPPPTFLLFMPLGLLDLKTAQLPWHIINTAALILAIIVLWKEFFTERTITELLFTAMLVVVGRAAYKSIFLGQNNFLVLLAIALFWRDRNRVWGGVWLALAFLFKPFFGLMGLYLLLTKRWRAISGILLTAVLLSGVALLVFGPTVFFSFFDFNIAQQPDSYYTMIYDQSLLSTILRATHYDFSLASPMLHPLYLIIVAIITVITIWLIIKLDRINPDYGPALTLGWAALAFPHILDYYALLLIPSILFIWKIRDQIPGKIWSILIILLLLYGFMGFRGSNYMIVTLVINWLTLAGLGIQFLLVKPSQDNSSNKTSILTTSSL